MDDEVGAAEGGFLSLGELPRSQLGIDAATMLRRHIVDGQLPPGTRLVEREVASLLGVSRTPVRDALYFLEPDGGVDVHLRRRRVRKVVLEQADRSLGAAVVCIGPVTAG